MSGDHGGRGSFSTGMGAGGVGGVANNMDSMRMQMTGTTADRNYNTMELRPDQINFMSNTGVRSSMDTLLLGRSSRLPAEQEETLARLRAKDEAENKQKRFGTFNGVVVRCLLNIWGVIMFLRLGWVVAHAGVWQASLIILVSLLLTVLTALSMSAITTNGEVGGGGAYYMISRSLGPAFGGSIGLIFALANAVAISLYLVGFAEVVVGIHPGDFHLIGDGAWDIRVYAFMGLAFLFILCVVGVDWVVKFDIFQLILLCVGILMFFIGSFGATSSDADLGYTGLSSDTFASNWNSDYRNGQDVISVFAVFFPAVTGMMAGANISGDLKNAQKSIPKGTMIAVNLSIAVYMIIAWVLGLSVEREAPSGGLYGDSLVMIRISWVPELVFGGVFASTLSSALASIVGAPRILKAVCEDHLFPIMDYFAVGRKSDNEPIRGYVLCVIIAIGCILIGDLNRIAELITNFFLFNRALINYACFAVHMSKAPGWRPTFKYYNPYVALVSALMCVGCMFAISWSTALITFVVGYGLYKYVEIKDPEVNWGVAGDAAAYRRAAEAVYKLQNKGALHVKTWRPSFLLLGQCYREKLEAYRMLTQLNKGKGFVFVGRVHVGSFHTVLQDLIRSKAMQQQQQAAIEDKRARQNDSTAGDTSGETRARSYTQERRDVTELVMSPGGTKGSAGGNEETDPEVPDERKQPPQQQAKQPVVLSGTVAEQEDAVLVNARSQDPLVRWEESRQLSGLEGMPSTNELIKKSSLFSCVESVIAPSYADGVGVLLQTAGIPGLRPNTVALSFPQRAWAYYTYLSMHHRGYGDDLNALFSGGSVRPSATRRSPGVGGESNGMARGARTIGDVVLRAQRAGFPWQATVNQLSEFVHTIRQSLMMRMGICVLHGRSLDGVSLKLKADADAGSSSEAGQDGKGAKYKSIDVFWLADTGGLTVLMPHILKRNRRWRKCPMRVFLDARGHELDERKTRMMLLLRKLRIDHKGVFPHDMWATPEGPRARSDASYLKTREDYMHRLQKERPDVYGRLTESQRLPPLPSNHESVMDAHLHSRPDIKLQSATLSGHGPALPDMLSMAARSSSGLMERMSESPLPVSLSPMVTERSSGRQDNPVVGEAAWTPAPPASDPPSEQRTSLMSEGYSSLEGGSSSLLNANEAAILPGSIELCYLENGSLRRGTLASALGTEPRGTPSTATLHRAPPPPPPGPPSVGAGSADGRDRTYSLWTPGSTASSQAREAQVVVVADADSEAQKQQSQSQSQSQSNSQRSAGASARTPFSGMFTDPRESTDVKADARTNRREPMPADEAPLHKQSNARYYRSRLNHFLRVGQLIRQNCTTTACVCITLPFLPYGRVTERQYLNWIAAIRDPSLVVLGRDEGVFDPREEGLPVLDDGFDRSEHLLTVNRAVVQQLNERVSGVAGSSDRKESVQEDTDPSAVKRTASRSFFGRSGLTAKDWGELPGSDTHPHDEVPMLLIRGTQRNVLTYYM